MQESAQNGYFCFAKNQINRVKPKTRCMNFEKSVKFVA